MLLANDKFRTLFWRVRSGNEFKLAAEGLVAVFLGINLHIPKNRHKGWFIVGHSITPYEPKSKVQSDLLRDQNGKHQI